MAMIKLFDIDDRDFNSNGKITIEPYSLLEYKETSLNGWFIEMEIPIKYDEAIKEGMIAFVETKSKGGQPFRISNPQRSHKILTIKAHHITFDSSDYVLEDVRPTNMSAAGALKYVNDRTDTTSPFKTNSNVSGSNTAYFINKSLFEALDTIQERWGGVYDCDKFQIELRESVGTDRGDTIMYGKNLEGLSVYEDWSNVVTKLLPVGFDGLRLPETYLYSEIDYGKPYTKVVKFETELEDEERTEQALLKELRANAWSYLLENEVPKISYELESNIEQELGIGDVIHVKHPVVNIQTEVIAYEYNILTRRTQKIIFGNYKRSVNKKVNTIKEIIGKIEQKTNEFDVIVKDQSDLINSLNKFGYVYQDDNQIMIVDSLPKETAKKVWRWNAAGLGYSKNGIEGPFEYAWTMDGSFNTNFISANSIMTNQLHSEVGSSLDISSNKSIQMLVSNLSEGNLILNLNGTLDMANNTYPYYIFNQNGLQTVFQTIQQTRHMGSPIFRVVADKNSVSGYSKQYEFKGKALATEYAYIVPDTIYSYRCKRTKGNTPMDVYVVEYDGDKKQIKRTKFTLDGQNMIESFTFTPAQMTMWARLEFFNNIEEPFNIAEEMFVRGEPVKWSEDANEVKVWAQTQFNMVDDTISMTASRVDSLNNDIHNAGLEINAKEGITVWGKKFSIWNEDKTREIMGVETISGKEQMFINGVFTSGDDSNQLRLKDGRIEQKMYNDPDFEPVIWFQKGSTYINGRTDEFGHGNMWMGIKNKWDDPYLSYVVVEKERVDISGDKSAGINSNDGEVSINGGGGVDLYSNKGNIEIRTPKAWIQNNKDGNILMSNDKFILNMSPNDARDRFLIRTRTNGNGIFVDNNGGLMPFYDRYAVNLGWVDKRWEAVYLMNQPNVSSDKRYKYNIHDIDPLLLDSFEELREKAFVTKHDDKFSFGYIAQDVERCLFKYVTKVWGFKEANEWLPKFKLLSQSESYKSLLYAEVQVIMQAVERRHRERLETENKQLRREHDTLVEILKEKGVI